MTDLPNLLELLRDGVWQGVGAILALLGLAVALFVYRGQAKYKEVAVGTQSSRSVVEVDGEMSEQLEVTYAGKKVDSVGMLVLVLRNTGNLPILASDFIRPITISFPERTRILSARASRQWPTDLDASISVDADGVQIAPLLLNPLDALELQILIAPARSDPIFSLRATDVPKLRQLEFTGASASATFSRFVPYSMFILLLPMLASMPIVFRAFPDSHLVPYAILVQLLAMLGLLGSKIAAQFGRKGRRLFRDA